MVHKWSELLSANPVGMILSASVPARGIFSLPEQTEESGYTRPLQLFSSVTFGRFYIWQPCYFHPLISLILLSHPLLQPLPAAPSHLSQPPSESSPQGTLNVDRHILH